MRERRAATASQPDSLIGAMAGGQHTALVTGANRGIGFEVARQLAELGMRIVLTARDPELGEEAAVRLGYEGQVRVEQLDVSDSDSVVVCAERLARDGVEVDVLVNNAGLYTTTPLLEVDERRCSRRSRST